jgi:hypothetical protein
LKGHGQAALIIRWWPAIIEKARRYRKEVIVGGYQWHGLQMSQSSRNSKTRASRQKISKLLAGSDHLRPSTNSEILASESQFDRFVDAARKIGCDEDPAHFDEILKKVARHKPPPHAPPEPKKPKAKSRG